MAVVRLPADFLNDSHDVVACVRQRLAELAPVIDLEVSDFDSETVQQEIFSINFVKNF